MMTQKERAMYVKNEEESPFLNVKLAGTGNCCPVCGLAFKATPPMLPIKQKDREAFYGGRVLFLKQVKCQCTAEYNLCITKRFDATKEEDTFKVIDMIILKEGIPLAELRKQEQQARLKEAEEEAVKAIAEAIETDGAMPTITERNEIKKQTILATIADKEEKLKTLTTLTTKELQTMCKRRKLKFAKRDTKQQLAETLLAYDPSMVVANPQG